METSKDGLEVAPIGICDHCLAQMQAGGKAATRHSLGEGRLLFSVFCIERDVGAFTLVGPTTALQWTMVRPIDAVEFEALVGKAIESYHLQRKLN